MISIKLTAPAKINLFLKVLDKRKDGYHNIISIFEKISLADKIAISKIPSGITISCDKSVARRQEDNIAYKAAKLILDARKVKGGVRIDIKKDIPIAAGLGGGSSDAASVLIGVNKLYGLRLSKNKLLKLAASLGADVPFFILDKPFAVARGLGDKLEGFKLPMPLWHIIVYHGPKTSTKKMYEAFDARNKRLSIDLTRDFYDDKISASLLRSMNFNALESMLYNNLEEIASAKNPVTGSILERLAYSTGRRTIITGSGPSVFCLCRTRKEAIRAKESFLGSAPAVEKKDWQVFVTKTQI